MDAARDDPLLAAVREMSRIDEVLSRAARLAPEAPCASFDGRHWTHAGFDALVGRAAAALRAAGLRAGDRVALMCTPRPEYLLVLMAVSRAGGVYVGLHPRCTAVEVAQLLQRVHPRLLLCLRSFEGQDLPSRCVPSDTMVEPPPLLAFDDLDELLQRLESLPALPAQDPAVADSAALERCAAIVFTSGTTGRPKAAMLTHDGLLWAAAVQHLRLSPPAPRLSRLLCHLPINHVGCLMNLTLGALVGQGSVVFLPKFSAAATLRLLVDEGVNVWLQVPAMFHDCVGHPAFDPDALRQLHSICIGGGAPSAATLQRLRESGVPLFVEYGQTETSSSGAYSDPGADDEVLTHCIGRFDAHFEMRIVRPDDSLCAVAEVGEIQARGRLLFAGYFGDAAATREAFTADGWLHTGDLAEQRADGQVVLRGRLKEMIKSGGLNVYPREVEQVLESHPGVAQVVVLGLPDERLGEAVHAVLSLRDAPPDRAALDALCRSQLANYKVPKSFRAVDRFALLPNGKIDRVATRAMAPGLPRLE